ncbi:hypothetical protein [Natronosalvus caseinilyticus]|uniref:hypothetical protein n=1 Tax=Natronosalvus caseinilyticus TaxID=2953747 RepID=UPI0028A89A09|nr:hypothetical protein [Natronosalvus caseinilyticus]
MTRNIDWEAVGDRVREKTDDPMTPVSYEVLSDALCDVEQDIGLPGGYIENAVCEGILKEHRGGSDATYSFNLNTRQENNNNDKEKVPDPIKTGEVDLPSVLTVEDDPEWPEYMAYRNNWVLGLYGEKQPRAPWQGSGLYPCKWKSTLRGDERPETSFDAVCQWVKLVNGSYRNGLSQPDNTDYGRAVPAYQLPPSEDWLDENRVLLFIDWDDVRDPETGEIIEECLEWLEKLNSVTEVSSSGTGLHTFVVATKMSINSLAEDLHTEGKVEIYQTKRFASMTGEFIAELPSDVAEAEYVVEELIDEYHEFNKTADAYMEADANEVSNSEFNQFGASSGEYSPYYAVNCMNLIIEPHRVGSEIRGGHPEHGANSRMNNIAVTGDGEIWRCYQDEHRSGGNALHLVAVCEGYISCSEAGSGCLKNLSDVEFTRLCMDARDYYDGFTSEMKPPSRALLGAAKAVGLASGSADEFDATLYDIVRDVYDNNLSKDI